MLNGARLALAAFRIHRDPTRLDEVLETIKHLAPREDVERVARVMRASSPDSESAFAARWIMHWDPRDLARYEVGTLGRAVHDHCARWNIHPSAFPHRPRATDGEYLVAHIENTHDVWHPVTGFDSDFIGEIGLQAFYLAQFPNLLGVFLLGIAQFRALTHEREQYPRLMDEVTRGWLLGKRARSFFGVRWDAMWDRPLSEVRRDLGIAIDEVQGATAPCSRDLTSMVSAAIHGS
jgi:ubiquinone biosynthesis protein Coq4